MPSRFRIQCLTIAKDARYEKIALILQKQLYEIGVDMEIEALPGKELDCARMSVGHSSTMLLMERTSGRSLAWTYLVVPFEPELRRAYTAADTSARATATRRPTDAGVRTAVSDLQQIFHDDPPAIFIVWPKVARVVSTKFVVPDEGGTDVMSRFWLWRPAADRPMRRITSRFVLLIASAAIAPLVVYGAISLLNLQAGHRIIGQRGKPAGRGSGRGTDRAVHREQHPRAEICGPRRSAASTCSPGSSRGCSRTIVIDFPEFSEITFFGAGGRVIATSRVGDPTLSIPDATDVGSDGIYIAPLQIDEMALPRTTIAVQVRPTGQEPGWVVAEIALEELWEAVDRVRVWRSGLRPARRG